MATQYDLATLEGHLEPAFKHKAEAIVFEVDSVGTETSVKEAIDNLAGSIIINDFPSEADNVCELGLNIGQFVYVDATGILKAALADDISTSKVIGVISDTDVSGTPCTIKATGSVSGYTGLIPGARYFLSETVLGGIQTTVPITPGHVIKFVGTAMNATTLFIDTSQPLTIRT